MGHGRWVLLCGDGCARQSSKRELKGESMGFLFIWLCIGGGGRTAERRRRAERSLVWLLGGRLPSLLPARLDPEWCTPLAGSVYL